MRQLLPKIVVYKIIKIRKMTPISQNCFPESVFLYNHEKLVDLFDS